MVALLASRAGTFTGDLRAADLFSVDGLTYAAGLFAAWDDLGEVASAPVLGLPLRESYGVSPGDDRRVEFRETEV